MNKGTITAGVLALVAFVGTKYLGMDLEVADGVTLQNQLLVWVNAALAGGGALAGAKYLPNVNLPKLGGPAVSDTRKEFSEVMEAFAVLDEFLGTCEYCENARQKVMLAIRAKSRGVTLDRQAKESTDETSAAG